MDTKIQDSVHAFVSAYRIGSLKNNELIAFTRESVQWFSEFKFRKVYELEEKVIWEMLNRCESVYFTDLTGSYDDIGSIILDKNNRGELGSYILRIASNGMLPRSEYERYLKKMDYDVKTELASRICPSNNIPYNMFTKAATTYLGMGPYYDSFPAYRTYVMDCTKLIEQLTIAGIVRADLHTVYEFLLFVYVNYCKND